MGRDKTPKLGFIHDWVLNFKVKYLPEQYLPEKYSPEKNSSEKYFTIDPKVFLCVDDFTSLVNEAWETVLLKMSAFRNGLRFDFAACLRDNKLLQKLYEKNQILLRDLGVGSLDIQKAFLDEAFIYHYVRILERPWNSDNKNSLPTLQHIPEKLFTFNIEDLHRLEHKAREERKRLVREREERKRLVREREERKRLVSERERLVREREERKRLVREREERKRLVREREERERLVREREERDVERKRGAIVTRGEALLIMQSTKEEKPPIFTTKNYMRQNAAINLKQRASLTPEESNTINEERKKLVQAERAARAQRDAERDAERDAQRDAKRHKRIEFH